MLGQLLITIDGLVLIFGAYLVDWNETHVHNPMWTPHAKCAYSSYI